MILRDAPNSSREVRSLLFVTLLAMMAGYARLPRPRGAALNRPGSNGTVKIFCYRGGANFQPGFGRGFCSAHTDFTLFLPMRAVSLEDLPRVFGDRSIADRGRSESYKYNGLQWQPQAHRHTESK